MFHISHHNLRSSKLLNDELHLDPRPEYVRAKVISKQGKLYAEVTGNQVVKSSAIVDDYTYFEHFRFWL